MSDATLLLAVLALAIGTYAIRVGGVGLGGSRLSLHLRQWGDPAVIVLIASVAATATLYEGQAFAGWARVAGVAAAAGLAALRAPLVVVVVAAAGVAASLRALGIH
ncbi:AzlD domain-containing protein [Dietzia sp. PP-33]|uniref:AzlD domain-containing protein n=1 Tax=Dietzia sp. PP-33 TaxID=2957500 RepID=UPI0029A59070|nr:AzlD domain-containing protein [Dietzia sp. PP-33]MDX2358909.1 AzlD domain-containing protein [Dietzia sp. PP-33]